MRSTNRGDSWQAISKDLTANDPAQMLLKSANAIPYQTIVALAESPKTKGLIYAGTDDGRLHVTRDGGATWTELTREPPDDEMDLESRAVGARRRHGLRYRARAGRR